MEVQFPKAAVLSVGLDHLHTHPPAALYTPCRPAEACRMVRTLDVPYTPKHGSWLTMAEIELAVLSTPCLAPRLGDHATGPRPSAAWEQDRHAAQVTVNWPFTTAKARRKLKRLYPR